MNTDQEKFDKDLPEGDNDDIIPEKEEENPSQALKRLRGKLNECVKEKQEYLEGWQRAQADMANVRRTAATASSRAHQEGVRDAVQNILPALDALEVAKEGKDWESLSDEWRSGVEAIERELFKALARLGVSPFGEVGTPFDPSYHEAVATEETAQEEQDGEIAKVLQRGYGLEGVLIRPAKVIIYRHND